MIKSANNIIDEAITSTREISNNLLPRILEDFGLDNSLNSFCDKISKTNSIKVKYKSINYKRIEKNKETAIFRIVSELINNTIKHASAKEIDIKLESKFIHSDCSFDL